MWRRDRPQSVLVVESCQAATNRVWEHGHLNVRYTSSHDKIGQRHLLREKPNDNLTSGAKSLSEVGVTQKTLETL